MGECMKGEDCRRTTVCIDSYENGVPAGRMYNRYLPEGKAFYGVTQFLLEMEKMFNDTGFPKAFTELRRFTAPPDTKAAFTAAEQKKGALATFTVRILFRQNASWQGSVIWENGRQEQYFRSVLELILLMDSALEYEDVS